MSFLKDMRFWGGVAVGFLVVPRVAKMVSGGGNPLARLKG